METFEPGIKSPYANHIFQEGKQGMKCRSCERVMTFEEWREKQRCFCKSTNVVKAIARRGSNTIRLDNRRNSQPPTISNSTPPRNATYSSSQSQLPRRDTVSSSNPTNSTSNTYSATSSHSQSTTSNSSSWGWGHLGWVIFIIFGLSMCNSLFNQKTQQPANHWAFPMSACGDDNPYGQQAFYPVFVNKTDRQTLGYIKTSYCTDAYVHYRRNVGRSSIQVASFQSLEKAKQFARIMLLDTQINSAEIGSPSFY